MLAGIVEFLGWFGAVTVLAGYILFSTGKIPNGPLYQLFNLVGGLSVAINVAAHHAIPSTIVNGIWAVVAVVVLVKMAKARLAVRRGASVPEEHPVLLAEPPATTAVLPVIGPALRDHDDAAGDGTADADAPDASTAVVPEDVAIATSGAAAARSLQSDATTSSATTSSATPPSATTPDATPPTAVTPTVAAPMTESVPVITATIALALVAAAQDQAAQEPTTR